MIESISISKANSEVVEGHHPMRMASRTERQCGSMETDNLI